MRKKDALLLLKQHIEEYSERKFRFHPTFKKEFTQLLKDASGQEKELFSLLIKQFYFVGELGLRVNEADSNEILKYSARDFYSLHLSGKYFNIRILMAFDDNNDPVFLGALYERGGKKVSDYTGWPETLESRYNEL